MSGQVLIAAGGWHDDSPGGAYRLPTDFARYLAARGRRVMYLCPARRGGGDPELCQGVLVYRYSSPGFSSPGVANLMAHLHRSRATAARIASHCTIETLLGHSPLQYLGALSGCRPRRKCYTVHSPFVAELGSNWSDQSTWTVRAACGIARRIEKYIYSSSDVVQCFSEYIRRDVQRHHGLSLRGKIVVIPAWVDFRHFSPSGELPSEVRARMGGPWDPRVTTFITVRRLVPRMGLDTLLEAAAILSHEGYDFKLVVAGEGPELENLRNQSSTLCIQSRVTFLGRVPEERLADVFRAGDCFVLPTRALEGFGLIILEAYACGTPVIAVPEGAIPEVLGDSLHDWLARDKSPVALARRMGDFLRGQLIADTEQLRRRALEFNFESMAALHERTLLDMRSTASMSFQRGLVS